MKPSSQRTQSPQTAIRVVAYLLVFVPAAFGFLYVYWFGVNVMYGDSLSMVNRFAALSSGTLTISDVFQLHNEHWIVVPTIATLVLGTLTQWNSLAEMYLTQVCLLGTLICLVLALRDGIRSRSAFFPLVMIPISLLVFSLAQHHNMLTGFQITFVLTEAFGVLTLFLLYMLRHERLSMVFFVAALGSAVMASLSAAVGLPLWLAGLLQLLLMPIGRPAKWIYIAVWSLATAGVWIAYFAALAAEGGETGSTVSVLAQPLAGMEYFLSLLGSPLFGNRWAFEAGLFLACLALVSLFVVFRDRQRLGEYSFWVSLLSWSFLILASIVAGRFARDIGLAVAPRYASFAILAIVSIYGMLAVAALGGRYSIRRPSVGAISLVVLTGVVVLSAVVIYPAGLRIGSRELEAREEAAVVLSTYESRSDAVLEEHFMRPSERVRNAAVVLERLELSVFSEESSARRSQDAG